MWHEFFKLWVIILRMAIIGFAPDMKVWEVVFSKTGEYHSTSRAFELRGHTSGILDFNFSCDSSRMATVSKDGSWKVYNTKSKTSRNHIANY